MNNEFAKRPRQVGDMIQREVAVILQREVSDPRLSQVSITSVSLSPDLKNARIYFTLLDNSNLSEVMKALEKASGFIRHCVATRTSLRYTPRLEFSFDQTLESAERMTRMLQDLPAPDEDDEEKT